MSKIKIVKYNFFRPTIKTNEDEALIDLSGVFERIRRQYRDGVGMYKIIYEYNGEPARLADINFETETGFYHLVFERLNYQIPSRTTLHGESQLIELEDDEYIGIDVNLLYDPTNHILMIQRNRDSLSTTGIESFISTILNRDVENLEGIFCLAIVSDENIRTRALRQSAYRKLHFKVIGTKADDIISRLTRNQDDLGIETVEVILSSKPNRSSEIDGTFARQLLQEYSEDPEVQKLRVRARSSEESSIEAIDLFDYKIEAISEFEFIENRYLNPISVFYKMQELYLDEYQSIIRRVCGMVENV